VGVDDVDGRAFGPYLFYCYGLFVFVTERVRRNSGRLWHIFECKNGEGCWYWGGEDGRGGGRH